MNKRNLFLSAAVALLVAIALAGCGTTTYFAGRKLPPSLLANRVLIAIQDPIASTSGALEIVDAFYDIRYKYNSTTTGPAFEVSGYAGILPVTIQNMPEELLGAVYSTGQGGNLSLIDYSTEKGASVSGLGGASSSVFITRNGSYVFAANQQAHLLTVIDRSNGSNYYLSLPGVYRISVNPGGSAVLAFVQNSDYVYYPRKLTAAQTTAFSGGPNTWPKAAIDCEPQNLPVWCLFQAQSPDHTDATGSPYGAPLAFDRPVKAVFSADGGTAYVLNCGPECGSNTVSASVTAFPVAPLIFLVGQQSGTLPTQTSLGRASLGIPGGASNALVNGSTLYVAGQQKMLDGFWGGQLTTVALHTSGPGGMTNSAQVDISDGAPGTMSRMILADDNTLWIGMINCINGERANHNQPYGCLTRVNTTTNVAQLMPYKGDATGIAAVTGLHKIYTAEGGQVYIYSTVDGTAIDNQYVTVNGTAYDVAYMDAVTDTDNTVY